MNKRQQLNYLLNRKEEKKPNKEKMSQEQIEELEEERRVPTICRIPFRDIEETLDKFDQKGNISQWIEQIEESAAIYDWNTLETLVYARRLITGLPKRFVTIELKPKTWNELKEGLRKEYGKERK